jgi:hypothetical protein
MVLDDVGSDHLPVSSSFNLSPSNYASPPKALFNYRAANWSEFQKEIDQKMQSIPEALQNLNSCAAISRAAQFLQDCIQNAAEKTIPTNFRKHRDFEKLPPQIIDLIKYRRLVMKDYIKTQNPQLKPLKNQLSALIKKKIFDFRQSRWITFCNKMGQPEPENFWTDFRKVLISAEKRPTPKPLVTQGKTHRFPPAQAEIFAQSLSESFSVQKSKNFDPNRQKTIDDLIRKNHSKFNPKTHQRVTEKDADHPLNAPITLLQLNTALRFTKNKAPGHDNISVLMLKFLPESGKNFLIKIYNASFDIGFVPKIWKKAIIIMIPKPDKDPSDPSSYRPISLLPVIAKMFEKILATRLSSHLEHLKAFNPFQSGFRRNHQTQDHLLRLTECVARGFNYGPKGKVTVAAFADVAKAFDSVWHNGLRYKISEPEFGFDIPTKTVRWISDYLKDRTFQVRVGDALSTPTPIKAGVPQGGSLSALLYILYVNDIPLQSQGFCDGSQFADDIGVWATSKNLKNTVKHLQTQLNSIGDWCDQWLIKLNPEKTQIIVFNKKAKKEPPQLKLSLNGHPLLASKTVKFLGLTFDQKLNFQKHTAIQDKRCRQRMGALRSVSGPNFGPPPIVLERAYTAYIRPVLEYGAVAWTSQISPKTWSKIEIIQRRALKLAHRLPMWTPTVQVYEKSKVEPLKPRILNLARSYLQKSLKFNSSVRNYCEKYQNYDFGSDSHQTPLGLLLNPPPTH